MNFKLKTMQEKLKYFKIAKELNDSYHDELKKHKFHFRGNINSFSLISLSQISPERGKSGLLTISNAEKHLKKLINNPPSRPSRPTEEKNIQAFVIDKSMNNNGILPFGDYEFITSEIAFPLDDNKRIVNDILALNSNNDLVIIELKSLRDSYVKKQTEMFEEKVAIPHKDFVSSLVELMIGKKWNGKIKKVAVWPAAKPNTKPRKNNHQEVKVYGYKYIADEKRDGPISSRYIIIEDVQFQIES